MERQLGELRLLALRQTCPCASSAPVVDEGLHAAVIVAANDAAIDRVRNTADFFEQPYAPDCPLQQMKATRLNESQGT